MIRKPKSSDIKQKTLPIDPQKPRPETIARASRFIREGGVVGFPTRYLYGLGADALNPDAVSRVYEIKRRSYQKPLLVLINQPQGLSGLVRNVPTPALSIMDRFWPGDITIVFEAKKNLPDNLTGGTGKIGVRLPQHPVAAALVHAVQRPITATSANLAGHSGCSRISDLDPLIAEQLDLILDAGPLAGGQGSTVVDVTTDPPKILRQGAISAEDIFKFL